LHRDLLAFIGTDGLWSDHRPSALDGSNFLPPEEEISSPGWGFEPIKGREDKDRDTKGILYKQ